MEFPPVSQLLNATFEGLQRNAAEDRSAPAPQSTQPVSNSEDVKSDGDHFQSGNERDRSEDSDSVGARLNTSA